jgi:hypothetical protein
MSEVMVMLSRSLAHHVQLVYPYYTKNLEHGMCPARWVPKFRSSTAVRSSDALKALQQVRQVGILRLQQGEHRLQQGANRDDQYTKRGDYPFSFRS